MTTPVNAMGEWPYVDVMVVEDYATGDKKGTPSHKRVLRIHMDVPLDSLSEADVDTLKKELKGKPNHKKAYEFLNKKLDLDSDWNSKSLQVIQAAMDAL